MKNIQRYRTDSILDTKMRYEEGILTRREWLNLKEVQGWSAHEELTTQLEFNRTKYNRLTGKAQEEYEKKCTEKTKTVYSLRKDRYSFDITKTEYEYFKSRQLQMDIDTERNELSNKIEAGIATQEEIDRAEEVELSFFNKYFNQYND